MDIEFSEVLKAKHSLSYHIDFLLQAQSLVGLAGKKVFEIGGSLPRELVLSDLGCAQWVCIEETKYWDEVLQFGLNGTPPTLPMNHIKTVSSLITEDYKSLSGDFIDVPSCLYDQFDVVYSSATFEHLLRFPDVLEKAFKILKPGGVLFSAFSPIWSSLVGHHLPTVVTQSGLKVDFGYSPIRAWQHLLFDRVEMYTYLYPIVGQEAARTMCYFIYTSPHINRFYYEDYVGFVKMSSFGNSAKIIPFPDCTIAPEVHAELVRKHGNRNFTSPGMTMLLFRPK